VCCTSSGNDDLSIFLNYCCNYVQEIGMSLKIMISVAHLLLNVVGLPGAPMQYPTHHLPQEYSTCHLPQECSARHLPQEYPAYAVLSPARY